MTETVGVPIRLLRNSEVLVSTEKAAMRDTLLVSPLEAAGIATILGCQVKRATVQAQQPLFTPCKVPDLRTLTPHLAKTDLSKLRVQSDDKTRGLGIPNNLHRKNKNRQIPTIWG